MNQQKLRPAIGTTCELIRANRLLVAESRVLVAELCRQLDLLKPGRLAFGPTPEAHSSSEAAP